MRSRLSNRVTTLRFLSLRPGFIIFAATVAATQWNKLKASGGRAVGAIVYNSLFLAWVDLAGLDEVVEGGAGDVQDLGDGGLGDILAQ